MTIGGRAGYPCNQLVLFFDLYRVLLAMGISVQNSPELIAFVSSLGKLFRKNRRGLPCDVVLATRDLLRVPGVYFQPKAELTRCPAVRVARGDIADALTLLKDVAVRAEGSADCTINDSTVFSTVYRKCYK